jgi:O-antigen/teichoic acid export membrane protein
MSMERAASAGAWSALDIVLRQGVSFVVSVILARLLMPADFGLIGLLTFFTSLSVTFVQGGLTLALIQRQDSTPEQENAIFWCNLAASALFCGILIVIAPTVARFYEQPVLAPLMLVAAGQVFLSALGAVQSALLTRSLRFDRLTIAGITSSLASGLCGVGAALAGWGVWALAAQILVAAAVSTATLWWVSPWRPTSPVRLAQVRSFLRFGAHISGASLLEVIYSHGFLLVIGKIYSIGELGLWNRATGVTSLPTTVIAQVIARTALPLFAEKAGDAAALRRGFRMALGLSMALSLPLMIGLSVLADAVVLALFGPKWSDAAPLLAVTALSGMLLPLQILNLNLLLATGGSQTYLKIEIWKKVSGIVIVGTGCFFGLIGVAYAALIASIVAFLINAHPSRELIQFGPVAQLRDLGKLFVAAGAMAAAVYAAKAQFAMPAWPTIFCLAPLGALTYVCVSAILRDEHLIRAVSLARSALMRRSGQARG